MKSYPNFEIDLVKSNGKTLSFSCSFIKPEENPPNAGDETYEDLFAIGKNFLRQINDKLSEIKSLGSLGNPLHLRIFRQKSNTGNYKNLPFFQQIFCQINESL